MKFRFNFVHISRSCTSATRFVPPLHPSGRNTSRSFRFSRDFLEEMRSAPPSTCSEGPMSMSI